MTQSGYPSSYYAATAHTFTRSPRLQGSHRADVCVIGGGFTGLSTALHLAEAGFSVALLEANRIGWGASGRNGGQVGSGQRIDTLQLEAIYGPQAAKALWELAEEGKKILRERIERHGIACDYRPGNLMAITKKRYLRAVRAETENLARHYDYDQIQLLDKAKVRDAVASTRYVGGALDHGAGHLHPLNFALGMARAAREVGVSLFEDSKALQVCWPAGVARILTSSGEVRSRFVAFCGNGYLGGLAPGVRDYVMPLQSYVVATQPLGKARASALIPSAACVYSTKFVVDYYRLSPDHRLLFGGGETYTGRQIRDIASFVRPYLLDVFPQLADVTLEYAWSGTVAITRSRMPHFARVGPAGFVAHGFSGHGVALSQVAGRLLAEAIGGTAERFDLMARLRHRRFAGGALMQRPLLTAGMLYYALRDRL